MGIQVEHIMSSGRPSVLSIFLASAILCAEAYNWGWQNLLHYRFTPTFTSYYSFPYPVRLPQYGIIPRVLPITYSYIPYRPTLKTINTSTKGSQSKTVIETKEKMLTEENDKVEAEKLNQENSIEDDSILDFSSGKAKVIKNTAKTVKKVVSKEEVVNEFQNGPLGFSKFKELSRKANIGQEIIDAGNVTIFSPNNQDFDKAPINFEEVEFTTLRRWMLKHFVKGFMFRKDMEFGKTPVETLGGEFITVNRPDKNTMTIIYEAGESKVIISGIKTEFGLVHVIDKPFN